MRSRDSPAAGPSSTSTATPSTASDRSQRAVLRRSSRGFSGRSAARSTSSRSAPSSSDPVRRIARTCQPSVGAGSTGFAHQVTRSACESFVPSPADGSVSWWSAYAEGSEARSKHTTYVPFLSASIHA